MIVATLKWSQVTTNTDGTAVKLPVTYNVYQGLTANALMMVQSGLALPTAAVSGLKPGDVQDFAVTAVASGIESAQSPVVIVIVPVPSTDLAYDFWWEDEDPDEFFADDFGNDDRPRPAAPTGLKVTL